jgi:microcompartment protein CcmK/EutM
MRRTKYAIIALLSSVAHGNHVLLDIKQGSATRAEQGAAKSPVDSILAAVVNEDHHRYVYI